MPHPARPLNAAVGPVRVDQSGDAYLLTVPAEIVAAARIEVGDAYLVEVVDGDVIYRRVGPYRPRGRFVGTGKDRYYELPRGATMPAGPDPTPRALMDWDF